MELPQSRLFSDQGRKQTQHDFLSLYSNHPNAQQDPKSPSQLGYIKTHDFLQVGKEETPIIDIEKRLLPLPLPSSSVEHILPGGIGTYSIAHISYCNSKIPKPQGTMFTAAQGSGCDQNENNSNTTTSYTRSGFTLWDELPIKRGKTAKENFGDGTKGGHRRTASERLSQSSTNNHRNNFSSLVTSLTRQKSQSFVEIIKSGNLTNQDIGFDDDDDELVLKQESLTPPPTIRELRVKVDGKTSDHKANTPRSKHSATEQRRRGKINDRFQKLREIIPHGDQKRDKASFLLEVIEYIQFLQEKVNKYEGSYQGWETEPAKLVPWVFYASLTPSTPFIPKQKNGDKTAESYVNQSRSTTSASGPALFFSPKLDEKNITKSLTIPDTAPKTVDSEMSSFPMSLQQHFFSTAGNSSAVAQHTSRMASDAENMEIHPPQSVNSGSSPITDTSSSGKLKEEELTIEGGRISISSVYSQGLLNSLTQALQSSGVDLSQSNISVQIELGRRANETSAQITKDNEVHSSDRGTLRSRAIGEEGCDVVHKKLKTRSR